MFYILLGSSFSYFNLVYICIYACMQYVYEAVLFVPYYTVHAVRTTLYRQRPASPGHGQPCPGGGQPA